jgi:lysophospholipase L1-like esterase
MVIERDGRFLEKHPANPQVLESGRWHSCNATFNDSSSTIRINGNHIWNIKEDFTKPQRIGFRSGHRNVFVDDVEIEQIGDRQRVNESFSNRKDLWIVLPVAVLMTVMIDALLLLVARRRLLRGSHALMTVITFNVALSLLVGSFWGYFVFIHSKKYPVADEQLLAREQQFVLSRTQSASAGLTDLCKDRPPNMPLVFFLGTSQTWGAGAARAGEDFVGRIQEMMQTGSGPSAVCLNGGVSGQSSTGLVNVYTNEWITCEPTLVVVNLSHNDNLPDEFRDALRRLAEINRSHGIQTLFVTEALSTEKFPDGKETHGIMKSVAAEMNVPLIDMHEYLAHHYAEGFVWWDHVHPTSFGHKLIAERLYPTILELLSKGTYVSEKPT